MGKVRSEEVKYCMENYFRFDSDLRERKYFSCETCWTCKSFNFQTNECTLTYDEAKRRAGDKKDRLAMTLGRGYFKPVEIKKPLWYRCSVWEERE